MVHFSSSNFTCRFWEKKCKPVFSLYLQGDKRPVSLTHRWYHTRSDLLDREAKLFKFEVFKTRFLKFQRDEGTIEAHLREKCPCLSVRCSVYAKLTMPGRHSETPSLKDRQGSYRVCTNIARFFSKLRAPKRILRYICNRV